MTVAELAEQMDGDRQVLVAIIREHIELKKMENRTEEQQQRFRLLGKALKAFERIE